VPFTEELRENTAALARETHALLRRTDLPPPADDERCQGCSLLELCLPQLPQAGGRASRYLEALLEQP
jgi:CRISPR-associated exonuclease Cas4